MAERIPVEGGDQVKRFKQVTAGRLVYAVCYPRSDRRDTTQARAEKAKMSSAAQDRLNRRHSWEKLEQVLSANFTAEDLVITLTYREEDLPADRDAAIRRLRAFIRDLRSQRKAQGLPTRYIYVTEGLHGDHRIHHHLVLNGTGRDAEAIRALWTWGDQIEIQPLDDDHYEALAKYLTKEPREHGNAEVGARTWTPSLGLRRPEVETADVPDAVTLTAPPGAIILERTINPTEFGEFAYLKYYLPRPRRPVPDRYVRRRENHIATSRNSGSKP